jgi:single-strand selective monofunctional uracil DNA glycosylase
MSGGARRCVRNNPEDAPISTLIDIADSLRREADGLTFAPPVSHVYDPLDYAWAPHREYLRRFGAGRREVLLVGMNPGPFGMAQTGVPFGDKDLVRDWMGIEAAVGRPEPEHPKRPIQGFACPRGEVSGQRLWGWARQGFGSAEAFFERFFVANYCPLVFMEESGRNRTPDKLPKSERDALYAVCDRAMAATVDALEPDWVLGIGRFAEGRIRAVVGDRPVTVGSVPHPSPASPKANQGWAPLMESALAELGVPLPG